MHNVGSTNISYLSVTIIGFGIFIFIGSINPIQGLNKEITTFQHYNNLKQLVDDIKNGVLNENKISFNDFKNSGAYLSADKNMQDCINLAAKIGHNLRDDEIVHCSENVNYFKNKYSGISSPETNASMNVPETNASQGENIRTIGLNITVAKDPITRGENQIVTAVAYDPNIGKVLDHVFIILTVKDPVGAMVKNYTATEGNLTRSFKVGENAVGKFTILTTASQAGIESRKSSTFQVQ